MNSIDQAARDGATRLWNAVPCGKVDGEDGSLNYFLEVERLRYEEQWWQHDCFRFHQYKDKRVLEIGIGHGTDLVQFANAGAVCHGADITDKHLELTARNFALRGLQVQLKKVDATALDFPDGYFDVVYSFGVLHHIPEAERVVVEIERVLKPGGTLLLALYRRWSFFHLYLLLVRGVLQGRLFRLGYRGLLATIETGADGARIRPYVKLYSRKEVRELLVRFDNVETSVRHMSLGRFERSGIGRLLRPLLRASERWLGWYLCVRAARAASAP